MRIVVSYIFILFLFTNCGSETVDAKTEVKNSETVKAKNVELIGKAEIPIEDAKLQSSSHNIILTDSIIHNLHMTDFPKFEQTEVVLEFETISEEEYVNYKAVYDKKIVVDNLIKFDSISFSFETAKSKYKLYTPNPLDAYVDYEYVGFLKPLNSYIIKGGGEESFSMFIVNKETDAIFNLDEYNADCPLISPQNTKLIMHYYSPYETDRGNYINIFHINADAVVSGFQQYQTQKWQSYEILWINEFAIALKVCDEIKYVENGERKCIGIKYFKSNVN